MPDIVMIRNLPSASDLSDGDYAAIDNSTDGLRKVALGGIITDLKNDLNDLYDAAMNMTDMPIAFKNDGANYIIYRSGLTEVSTTFDHTNYIDLTNVKKIKYRRTKSTISDPATGMAFYDSSKQYISGVQSLKNQESAGYDTELYSVDVPVNAKYARFSIYTDTVTYGQFALYALNPLEEKFEDVADAINEVNGDVSDLYDYVINKADITIAFEDAGASYIVYSDGSTVDSTNYNHTNYIDLTNVEKIKYRRTKSTGSTTATGIAFYDSSKQYISGVPGLANQQSMGYDTELYSVDVPANAKYARFSIYKDTSTYGQFALYAVNEMAEKSVFKNDRDETFIQYVIQKTNTDGTKTLAKASQNSAATLVFTPNKNKNYEMTVTNNDRLRVYGTKRYYVPSEFNDGTVGVEIIAESSNLNKVEFNSGDYSTIFVYLHSGSSTHDTIMYTLDELNETLLNDEIDTNYITCNKQSDKFDENKNGVLPDLSPTIPATAILYHAEWDDLVNKGLITRSTPTYLTGDTDHIYPLYTYTIKTRNQYIDENYNISENELSTIYTRPKILIVSGHHGNEPCTPWALLGFVKRVLEGMEHYDLVSQYEWTIIPLVNPYGFNARDRYNEARIDINRDYNDVNGFLSEEAQYVRNVFLADDYDIALDLHQSPFDTTIFTDRRLGFTSMNIKRTSETQDEYDELRKAFCKNVSGANARTDVAMMTRYGWKDIGQTAFLWSASNSTGYTFKNYTAGTGGNIQHTSHHTKITVTLETATRCQYLSGLTTDYNELTVQYTNEYVDEIIRAVIQTYEDVS